MAVTKKKGFAIKDATVKIGIAEADSSMPVDMDVLGRVLKGTTVLETSEGSETEIRDEYDRVVYSDIEAGKSVLSYSVFITDLSILKKIFGGTIVTTDPDFDILTGLKNGFSTLAEEYFAIDISWKAGVGFRVRKTKLSALVTTTTAEGILLKMKHTILAPDDPDVDMIEPYEPKAA